MKNELDFEGLCNMELDGASSKYGFGAGIEIISSSNYSKHHSFKLAFECRNNDVRFIDMEGALKGHVIMDKLDVDLGLLKHIKAILKNMPPPTYAHYTDLYMAVRKMKGHNYHMGKT